MDRIHKLSLKQRHQLGITYVPMKTDTLPESSEKKPVQVLDKPKKQSSGFFSFLLPTKSNT